MNNTNAIYIDLTAKSGATLRAIVVKKDAPDGAPTIEFCNVDAATSKPVAAISQALFTTSFERGFYKDGFILRDSAPKIAFTLFQVSKLYAWLDKTPTTLSPFIEQTLLSDRQRSNLLPMIASFASTVNAMSDKDLDVVYVKEDRIPLIISQVTQGQKPSLSAVIAIEELINPDGEPEMWSTDMLAFLKASGLQDVLKIVVSTMTKANSDESTEWTVKAMQGGSPFTRYVWADINPFLFAKYYYRLCPASMQRRLLFAEPQIIDMLIEEGEIVVQNLSYDEKALLLSLHEEPTALIALFNDVTPE